MSALANAAVQAQKQYKNGAFVTGSFLENHDQPRFQSITQDQALVKNAMMWPFVHDSIPVLYYGQEQGYTGNSDPNNREALWLTAFDTSKSLVGHVKSLNAARKAAMAANGNYTTVPVSATFPTVFENTLITAVTDVVFDAVKQRDAGCQKAPTSRAAHERRKQFQSDHYVDYTRVQRRFQGRGERGECVGLQDVDRGFGRGSLCVG